MIIKCEYCGKEYYIRPSHYKRKKTHFCSRKCFGLNERGENNPAWKNNYKKCLYCKKKFKPRGKKTKYCSRKCMGLDERKRNRFETKCPMCGKDLEATKYWKGKLKFCCGECADKYHSKRMTKDGNSNWRDGIGKLPWGFEFTDKLKREIKERDNYTCQICGARSKKGFTCHHIDYNKQNNLKNNLITLCSKCHGKTGYNRKKWKKELSKKLRG